MYIAALKTKYSDEIVPALMKEFGYKSIMQVPRLDKIVISQGVGQAIADKKLLEYGVKEMSDIAGQKAVLTNSTKDIQIKKKYAYRYNGNITQRQDV
jgi:large subunit ribosomal protein L5